MTELKDLIIEAIPPKELALMIEHFLTGAPETYGETHYTLATQTAISPSYWNEFLNHPKVQVFIEKELEDVHAANARQAMMQLGDAKTTVDIAKSKQFLDIQRKSTTESTKPFTIYAFPAEVMMYKDLLKQVYEKTDSQEIKDLILTKVPDANKKT